MALDGAELPPELIDQCHISRTENFALLELQSGGEIVWRFRISPRDSDRVKSFLKSHNVNTTQLSATPIVKPSISRIVPAGTLKSNEKAPPLVQTIVDRMFPEPGERVKRAMLSGENARKRVRPVAREPSVLSSTPMIPTKHLSSGSKSSSQREPKSPVDLAPKTNDQTKTSNTTNTAAPNPNSLFVETKPDALDAASTVSPKPKSSDLVTLDTVDGFLEPTAEFLETLAKTHSPIKFVHSDGRSTCLSLATIGRFQDNVYLDDTLICFFLKRFHEQMANPNATHIFDTQLYPRIETSTLSWTRKVDFASKRLLVIPIHHMDHWSAAVIYGVDTYIKGGAPPKVVYFDSLSVTLTSSRKYFRKCNQFLNQVFEARNIRLPKFGRYPKITAKVPIQSNGSDCGVYMLEYMRLVMENADAFGDIVANGSRFALKDIYKGEMRTRGDYLETLKEYGVEYPDNLLADEHESDLEIEVR